MGAGSSKNDQSSKKNSSYKDKITAAVARSKIERENTPLIKATRIGILSAVEEIISNYPELVNNKGEEGNTALHYSVITGNFKIFEYLMNHNADVSLKNNDAFTVSQLAAIVGTVEMIQFLKSKEHSFDDLDQDGNTILMLSACAGNSSTTEALCEIIHDINAKNTEGKTALHIASENGHTDSMMKILEHKPDIYLIDNDGKTPIEAAKKEEVVEIFLPYVDKDSVIGSRKLTGLHIVAELNMKSKLHNMVDHGFCVNAKDGNGNTPLHLAVDKGNTETAEILLDLNADPLIENSENIKPFELSSCGDEFNLRLLIAGGNKAVYGENNDSALHLAVKEDLGEEAINTLVTNGFDINASNLNGDTPLHYAANEFESDNDEDDNKEAESLFKLLISLGASNKMSNKQGIFPRIPTQNKESFVKKFWISGSGSKDNDESLSFSPASNRKH